MNTPDLNEAVVELTAPDGQIFHFRYGATIPYAGQDYVVLLEMEDNADGEEQILVTRLEEENGELSFVVAEEEDVIEQVFNKYCAMNIRSAVEGLPECDCHCDCHGDEGCGCHHPHEEGGCSCQHD